MVFVNLLLTWPKHNKSNQCLGPSWQPWTSHRRFRLSLRDQVEGAGWINLTVDWFKFSNVWFSEGPFYLPLYAFLFLSRMWWTGRMFLIYAVFWNKPKYSPWSEQIFPRDFRKMGFRQSCPYDLVLVVANKKNPFTFALKIHLVVGSLWCSVSYTYGIHEAWNFVYSIGCSICYMSLPVLPD